MKKITLLVALISLVGCSGATKKSQNIASFSYFEYKGEDSRFETTIDRNSQCHNPILAVVYPDPSICLKGDDYYLVNSSFAYFPGVPIFHSKDLVNWRQIGHVLERESQLNLKGIRIAGGIYAPAIEYNPHNDTFYMITTCVNGIGNFIVKTKDPMQGWSDPILLPNVGGIDPSLFFDDDGKGYIVHNDAPATEPDYDGHRAVWLHEFDPQTDQTFGERVMLLDGGIDKSTKPIWIEGPHLYKINGKYYLMAAEGGTGANHSEVILIADNVKGKYKPMNINPILTQRQFPAKRTEAVSSVGHADIIQTHTGEWFSVFLGCRPYREDMYNTGRETFLLPVEWRGDNPVILDLKEQMPTTVTLDNWRLQPNEDEVNYLSGNFTWREDFDADDLAMEWITLREPVSMDWFKTNGKAEITPKTTSIYEVASPAFLARRQQHQNFTIQTEMS